MGHMVCVRKGCGSSGSRTHIDEIGYICYPCRSEFAHKMDEKYGDVKLTKKFIVEELKEFVKTPTDESTDKITVEDFFRDNAL